MAPTPPPNDDGTSIANTAFVRDAIHHVGNYSWQAYDDAVQQVAVTPTGFATFIQWHGNGHSDWWCGLTVIAVGF